MNVNVLTDRLRRTFEQVERAVPFSIYVCGLTDGTNVDIAVHRFAPWAFALMAETDHMCGHCELPLVRLTIIERSAWDHKVAQLREDDFDSGLSENDQD